jgi:hypothetical protein
MEHVGKSISGFLDIYVVPEIARDQTPRFIERLSDGFQRFGTIRPMDRLVRIHCDRPPNQINPHRCVY